MRNSRGEFSRTTAPRRLSQTFVESLEPGESRRIVWDSDLDGFGLRIAPTGLKTYLLAYTTGAGIQRRMGLGRHPKTSAPVAKAKARRHLKAISRGEDPMQKRHDARQGRKERSDALRVADLSRLHLETFEQFVRAGKRSQNTLDSYRQHWQAVLPKLGRKLVTEVTAADVEEIHNAGSDTPYAANRQLATIRAAYSLAVKNDWCATNPAAGVERYREQHRQRLLSDDEVSRIGAALLDLVAEGKICSGAARAIRLLALTGGRRDEIRMLKTSQIGEDWIDLPAVKGGGTARMALTSPVRHLLADVDGWACPGPRTPIKPIPRATLRVSWVRVLERAGVAHAPIHTLRHLVAGVGASLGFSELVLSRILHHGRQKPRSVTQLYAHLTPVAEQAAAETIAMMIDAWLQGEIGEPAEVVNFPGGRA